MWGRCWTRNRAGFGGRLLSCRFFFFFARGNALFRGFGGIHDAFGRSIGNRCANHGLWGLLALCRVGARFGFLANHIVNDDFVRTDEIAGGFEGAAVYEFWFLGRTQSWDRGE